MTQSKFKTIVIRNAELFWAKLDKPVSSFGGPLAYEIVAQTADEAVANEWKGMNLNVKKIAKDGKDIFKVSLKRKDTNKAGDKNPAPEVIFEDPNVDPTAVSARDIGNGSIGHIRCFQYDYNVQGRSGTATQFNAVKIVKLKKYESADDIDF